MYSLQEYLLTWLGQDTASLPSSSICVYQVVEIEDRMIWIFVESSVFGHQIVDLSACVIRFTTVKEIREHVLAERSKFTQASVEMHIGHFISNGVSLEIKEHIRLLAN
jgi:hypothetical protein